MDFSALGCTVDFEQIIMILLNFSSSTEFKLSSFIVLVIDIIVNYP